MKNNANESGFESRVSEDEDNDESFVDGNSADYYDSGSDDETSEDFIDNLQVVRTNDNITDMVDPQDIASGMCSFISF